MSQGQEVLERFIEIVEAWHQAMERNSPRAANARYDEIIPILRSASRAGAPEIQRFVELVEHGDDAVAYWAAIFALAHEQDRAEKTLRRLSRNPTLHVGLSATWTLRELRRGTLAPSEWEDASPSAPKRQTLTRPKPRAARPDVSGDWEKRFTSAARRWAVLLDGGQARSAARVHDERLLPCLREAAARGAREAKRLLVLTNHAQPSVALWAAIFSLRHDPAHAEPVLERLSRIRSFAVSMTADTALRMWRGNVLELPWETDP